MVRAILAGTKTQTRRIAKLRTVGSVDTIRTVRGENAGDFCYLTDALGICWSPAGNATLEPYPHPEECCPYGVAGDRLYVKETFAPRYFDDGRPAYRADWTARAAEVCAEPKWKPSIFMPRALSRITLEITSVRVERLQSITEDDARAEGVQLVAREGPGEYACSLTYRDAFASLWDAINGKRASWERNPWVWTVSFRRVTTE